MTAETLPAAAETNASSELRHWLTDPAWPNRPRVWTRRQPTPPGLLHRLASLSHQVGLPLEWVTVDLATDEPSAIPLSGSDWSGR